MQDSEGDDEWKQVMSRIKSHITHSRTQFNQLQRELASTMERETEDFHVETEWEPGLKQIKGLIVGREADLLNLQMECLRDMAFR